MKKTFFAGLFLWPVIFSFATFPPAETCDCSTVSNVTKTGQGSSSATYSWQGVDGATGYKVWYVRGAYTSPEYTTTGASYTFTGLVSGEYTFFFKTVCGSEESSYIGNTDMLQL